MQKIARSAVETVWAAGAELGEGPVWDEETETLLWVDIQGRRLHAHNPADNENRSVELATEVGAVALRQSGGLVAATRQGFALLDRQTGAIDVLSDPEANLPDHRFNDGNCDPAGRFIAGSMHDPETSATGSVYSLEGDGKVRRLYGGYVVCNGPAFSSDGLTMYFCDSANRTLLAFDYDPETGEAGNSRPFAEFSSEQGYPDGITVDSDGCVWCAHWGGWRVTRFRPDGAEDTEIDMPVPQPTSCAFGGPDLNKLYVTSARTGLGDKELHAAPLSGALFCVSIETRGLPAARFNG